LTNKTEYIKKNMSKHCPDSYRPPPEERGAGRSARGGEGRAGREWSERRAPRRGREGKGR